MSLGILAKKMGMTQIFTDEGVRVAVTVLKIEDNVVLQKKTAEKDGYSALQIGFSDKREKNTTKPMQGHFKKAEATPKRTVMEWRVPADVVDAHELGANVGINVLDGALSVDVTSTSKGKGFAGVMKRHNFKGFRATHGTHEYFRHGGSIGCRSEPGKVHKGKKMAGQMGNEQVTTLNIRVMEVDPDEGLILLRGAVPGTKGTTVQVVPSSRTAKRIKGLSEAEQMRSKNPMKASKAGR